MCSLCFFLLIVILVIFHFDFEIGTLGLIASVPGHCLSFTFYRYMWDVKMSKIHGHVNMLFVMVFYKYYTRSRAIENDIVVDERGLKFSFRNRVFDCNLSATGKNFAIENAVLNLF